MNVSRRTFLASAALFALVRPNLLLKEELSALAEEPAVEEEGEAVVLRIAIKFGVF